MAGWPSRGFRVLAAATLLTAVGAEIAIAQITWGPPYQRNYETKGPVRGYSGHVRQGARVLLGLAPHAFAQDVVELEQDQAGDDREEDDLERHRDGQDGS